VQHATKLCYVIQVAKKGQQKVRNGWNWAGDKEAGHVRNCACVILVLRFAGNSSKIRVLLMNAVETGTVAEAIWLASVNLQHKPVQARVAT